MPFVLVPRVGNRAGRIGLGMGSVLRECEPPRSCREIALQRAESSVVLALGRAWIEVSAGAGGIRFRGCMSMRGLRISRLHFRVRGEFGVSLCSIENILG